MSWQTPSRLLLGDSEQPYKRLDDVAIGVRTPPRDVQRRAERREDGDAAVALLSSSAPDHRRLQEELDRAEFGENTAKALQTWLNTHWDQSAFRDRHLHVDGNFGPSSAKALQTFLNCEWDKAVAEHHKFRDRPLTVDGHWGASTTKALQKYLNWRWEIAGFRDHQLSEDGVCGPSTVRSLHRYLNFQLHFKLVEGGSSACLPIPPRLSTSSKASAHAEALRIDDGQDDAVSSMASSWSSVVADLPGFPRRGESAERQGRDHREHDDGPLPSPGKVESDIMRQKRVDESRLDPNRPGGLRQIATWEGKLSDAAFTPSPRGAGPESPAMSDLKAVGGFRRSFQKKHAKRTKKKWWPAAYLDMSVNMITHQTIYEDDEVGDADAAPEDQILDAALEKTRSKKKSGLLNTFLVFIKCFIGPGVLMLPHGFNNGGVLFSVCSLVVLTFFTIHCMILLLQCHAELGTGTFSEIGRQACGSWAVLLIDISVMLTQTGFCMTYFIFIAKNVQQVLALGDMTIGISALILIQLVVDVPFTWIRRIRLLAINSLVANVLILFGLVVTLGASASKLAEDGLGDGVELMFNPSRFALMLGTAVFSFEGIGVVLPIQDSMREPKRYPAVLVGTLLLVMLLFCAVGTIGYLAFGSSAHPVILLNLLADPPQNTPAAPVHIGSGPPTGSPTVSATVTEKAAVPQAFAVTVLLCYCCAVLLTFPVQLFPAVQIFEGRLFRPGPVTLKRKWQKNAGRTLLVAVLAAVAIAGASNFNNFVALIGSFCCVPLAFIYPALFHYKLVARSLIWRVADAVTFALGIILMIFVIVVSISTWNDPVDQ